MSKEMRQRPFITGFCTRPGGHDLCPAVIVQGLHGNRIVCTCTCHVSHIDESAPDDPEPASVQVDVDNWYRVWGVDPVHLRLKSAVTMQLRRLLAS